MWAIPLKNKFSQLITQEFSIILSTSKRSSVKLESDRGTEFYNSIFQNSLKGKKNQHYSRFTDKRASIAERAISTIRSSLEKPVFEKRSANWLSELPSVIMKYNNTIHSSMKMTPNQASTKTNEKEVYTNLHDRRVRQRPKFKLGQLIRTADIEKVFSKSDSTNYSYNIYKIPEVIHDTIPSYRIDYLTERYRENLLLPIKQTNEENNKVMKKLI